MAKSLQMIISFILYIKLPLRFCGLAHWTYVSASTQNIFFSPTYQLKKIFHNSFDIVLQSSDTYPQSFLITQEIKNIFKSRLSRNLGLHSRRDRHVEPRSDLNFNLTLKN